MHKSGEPVPETHQPDAGLPMRERILQSLGDVFYTGGTYLVGMSDLVKHLGVTRRTFYRAFESKEDLIVAYLERRDRLVRAHLAHIVAGRSGADAILAVFADLETKTRAEQFRGCAFLVATVENPGSQAVQAAAKAHKDFLKAFFLELIDEAPEAERRAERLLVLYEGALAGSMLRRNVGAAASASEIAVCLLQQWASPP